MKGFYQLSVFVLLGLLTSIAHAELIVDTGTPYTSTYTSNTEDLNNLQSFAGQFSLSQSYALTNLLGYFSNTFGAPDSAVQVNLYQDSQSRPGQLLYSEMVSIDPAAGLGWYGVSGVNWLLSAGSYWLGFIPNTQFYGFAPTDAPQPLADYVLGNPVNSWHDAALATHTSVGFGMKVSGHTSASVPEPGSVELLLAGMLAMLWRKRNTVFKMC